MKLTLLSTTALISAGLAAFAGTSRAQADQGVQLGIGGYYASAAGLLLEQIDKDGSAGHNTRDVVFRQDVEVYSKATPRSTMASRSAPSSRWRASNPTTRSTRSMPISGAAGSDPFWRR